MNRAAGVCSLVLGLGFGLPGVYGAWYYARQGQVWTFLGFPTYGDGPFERWGFPTNVALLLGFVAVCAAEVVVGVLLWGGSTIAPWLAFALLPVEPSCSGSASRCRSDRSWDWRAPCWSSPSCWFRSRRTRPQQPHRSLPRADAPASRVAVGSGARCRTCRT